MYEPNHISFDFEPTVGNVTTGRIAALWMPPGSSLRTEAEVVNQIELYLKTKSLRQFVTLWDWSVGSVQKAKRHRFNVPLPCGVRPVHLSVEQSMANSIGAVYFVLMTPFSSANLAPTGPTTSAVAVTGKIGQMWLNYSMSLHNPSAGDPSAVERVHTRTTGVANVPMAVTGTDAPNGRVLAISIPTGSQAPNIKPGGTGGYAGDSSVLVALDDGTFLELLVTLGSSLVSSVVESLPTMLSSAVGPIGEIFGFMTKLWGTFQSALTKTGGEASQLGCTAMGIPQVPALGPFRGCVSICGFTRLFVVLTSGGILLFTIRPAANWLGRERLVECDCCS
jgi:hypothetical protein